MKKGNIFYVIIKRLFDILFSVIGIIFLIPITIIVKIIYVFSGDFNSIFYVQKRIGKYGKEFTLFKFRTMVIDADKKLEELLQSDKKLADEYKKMKKLNNDPRITKIGLILRKTSLDELPQLLNVLLGDMSIVGNRPYLPREKKDMGKYFDDIVSTKPGITGYWQVSLRSRGTFEERLELEQYYSKNYSLKFDIKLLFQTVSVVLSADGAK